MNFFLRYLTRSLGTFVRTLRAFFMRLLNRGVSGARTVGNMFTNAGQGAAKSLEKTAAAVTSKPTKREDYIETKSALISKSFLIKLVIAIVLIILLIYFIIWPFLLSRFFTARFYVEDSKLATWTGKEKVYSDKQKTILLYAGRVENGLLQGEGQKYDEGELIYDGMFVDGLEQGNGVEYTDGYVSYVGNYESGEKSGQGTSYYPNGNEKHVGEYSQGLYEGLGREYDEDGLLDYSGNFSAGVYEGDGKSYYTNGEVCYKGSFSDGLYDGEGKLYDLYGDIQYDGSFEAGLFSGDGTLYLDKNRLLTATFAEGEPDGEVKVAVDGTLCYEGEWEGGQASGYGKLYDKGSNVIYEGQMADGTIDAVWLSTLSVSEVRDALGGADRLENVIVNDASFRIVAKSLGLTVQCSRKTDGSDPKVQRVFLYKTTDSEWLGLLPGNEQVTIPNLTEWSYSTFRQTTFAASPQGLTIKKGRYTATSYKRDGAEVTLYYDINSGNSGSETDGDCEMVRWVITDAAAASASATSANDNESNQAGAADRLGGVLKDLGLSDGGSDTAQKNPYYGNLPVDTAIRKVTSSKDAATLVEIMIDYWQQSELADSLEEEKTLTQSLVDKYSEQESMGLGDGEAKEYEDALADIEMRIKACKTQRKNLRIKAASIGVSDLSSYDMSGIIKKVSASDIDVSTAYSKAKKYARDVLKAQAKKEVAKAQAQAADTETDTETETTVSTSPDTAATTAQTTLTASEIKQLKADVRTAVSDLDFAITSLETNVSKLEKAVNKAEDTQEAYSIGDADEKALYDARIAAIEARADIYADIDDMVKQMNTINTLTGGWYSKQIKWNSSVFSKLFQKDKEY